jgi:uncharacterized protein YecT (DUF1311 family)
MQSFSRHALAATISLFAATEALSQTAVPAPPTQRIGDMLCDGRKLPPRDYTECLRKAQEESDRTMRDRIVAIAAVIDRTPALQPQQKARWKKALDDSQGLWMRFRNGECQELTPFESANKTRLAEEQRVCILEHNNRRMAELQQRYPGT